MTSIIGMLDGRAMADRCCERQGLGVSVPAIGRWYSSPSVVGRSQIDGKGKEAKRQGN